MSARAETVDELLDVEEPISLPAPDDVVLRLRQDILAGTHWFIALLDAIGRWRVPMETHAGRRYDYLIGGEAFDWLVLAERLLETTEDLVPPRESGELLFEGRWPLDLDDDEFAERIGQAKHRAYLNYLYGVLVEEALQLSVEEEVHKEDFHRAWGTDRRAHETALERIYGRQRDHLLAEYHWDTGINLQDRVSYQDWKAFVYYLFKRRLKCQDGARVASDTRKGLAQLTRMELATRERRLARNSVAEAAARAAGLGQEAG